MTFHKCLLIALTLSFFSVVAHAAIRVKATAPSQVSVGEAFQVQFEVNTQDISNFKAPSFAGFEVLYGPARSSMSSYEYVNGRASRTETITFTYTIAAQKVGVHSLGAATAVSDGKSYHSNALKIKVVASSGRSNANGGRTQSSTSSGNYAGNSISGKELFMTATASKTHVYEQEAILITLKVYSLVQLTSLDNKMPDMKGFHCQEVKLPQQKSFTVENHNGRNYRTVVWKQYVIFPQQSGKLEFPSITFDGTVAQENQSLDPMDAFFNTGAAYVEVKKKLTTPKIQITVDPLPAKPSNYSGGVGSYSITADKWPAKGKTGEAMTFNVVVKGNGNMKLIKAPTIKFPKDFEVYDPKLKDNTKLTSTGVSGNMTYTMVVVPKNVGNYTIPGAEFCYYDIASKSYKTVRTEPQTVEIAKGKGVPSSAYTDKESVKQLGQDILFIHTGDAAMMPRGELFWGSMGYILVYVASLVLFFVILILMRKHIADGANTVAIRGKKANKIATRRLRQAGKMLSEKTSEQFYDEVLRALQGYIADRFNIPTESMSKDNISLVLSGANVSHNDIAQLNGILADCEFARFAPGSGSLRLMKKSYDSAVDIIVKLEDSKKK